MSFVHSRRSTVIIYRKASVLLLSYWAGLCALHAAPTYGFVNRPPATGFAACAKRNFPVKAKPFVTEALVTVEVFVDENGIVQEVEPIEIKLVNAEKSNKAQLTMPMFARAGIEAFLGRRCPIVSDNGKAVKYRTIIPISYELRD
jgi:hypothetical protein